MLSHRSAAAIWNVGKELRGRVDVSVCRRCELKRPGLKVRGRPSLRPEDVVAKEHIPVTAITRTLVDLATEVGEAALERAVNEADKRDLIAMSAVTAPTPSPG